MQEQLTFEPRRVCPRCRRPESVCYCGYLTRIDTKTRIVLLQHPRERDMAIGTAHMASLCLPNSALFVGFDWEKCRALGPLLSDPERPAVLLYPGDGAIELNSPPPSGAVTLVVVDGTWANTKKMVRKNPILAKLPRVSFRPDRPSEYRIRREPAHECVSTIEALMYVLGILEGDDRRFQRLMLPFRKMIDLQLQCKAQRTAPRIRNRRPNKPQRSTAIEVLRRGADKIVCVGGEANAWPCRDLEHRSAYPDEIVQWVARRLSSGERFEFFAAPQNPLSPSTPSHLDIDAAVLHAGGDIGTLLERWRCFVQEDDIICSWGRYATSLFVRSGGYLPPNQFDLRLIAKDLLKRNIGTMDEFCATLDAQACQPMATGRAGTRLAQLARIARHFSDCPAP
jgi:DTW domain-containing protein